jgi:hypothetical protein
MNIRRGLIRLWVVLTVLLLIPVGITTYQNWVRASHVHEVEVEKHRFRVSGTIIGLPEAERNWVIHRIAWLKGFPVAGPADPKVETGLFADVIAEAAKHAPSPSQPLSPELEALAQGEQANLLPRWEDVLPWDDIWTLLKIIATLWAVLFVGFWIVAGFRGQLRVERLEPPRDEPTGT